MEHSIGSYNVGEATVEVGSSSKSFTVGEPVDIDVRLTDKSGDQIVDQVELELQVYYWTEDGYQKATVYRRTLVEDFSVDSGVTATRGTTITIPYETPSTIGSVDVVATTRFDVGQSTVKRERNLEIVPAPHFETVFDSVFDLGFSLHRVECRIDRTSSNQPFINTFDFRSVGGSFEDSIDRIVLFARTGPNDVTLYVAVDCDDGRQPVPRAGSAKTIPRGTERETVRNQLESVILQNTGH